MHTRPLLVARKSGLNHLKPVQELRRTPLLNRDFRAAKPSEKWLTDITEFQIPAGKVYLSAVIDCFDGMVVSRTLGTRPDSELVNTMLDKHLPSSRVSVKEKRTLRYLEATVLMALFLPATLLIIETNLRHTELDAPARKRLTSDAQVAAQHALRLFDTTDVLLQRTFDLLGDSDDESVRTREKPLHEEIQRFSKPLAHVQSMSVGVNSY